MNNNEFTYIKEVARQKSFSKASKVLGISQPALSNYVRKIEENLGVMLFDRSISPIEITEFGKVYLEYADNVLSATDRLNDVISDMQDLKKGEIKVGSVVCFSTGYLPGPMAKFHKKYPGITFKLVEEKVPEIMNRCLLGDVDIFLTDGRIDMELFDKEELFNERLLMAVPKESKINSIIEKNRVNTEDILEGKADYSKIEAVDINLMKDEEFVLLNEDQHVRRMVDNIFSKAGFTPKVILQTSQTVTGLAMTIANMGVSFVTETTVRYNNLKNHAYYYKIGTDEDSIRTMCIAYKKGKYISNAGRKFIEILKEELG